MFLFAARKHKAEELAPPRWKMMIASGVAIYPLILFLPGVLDPLTASLPPWLQAAVSVLCLTPLATVVMVPFVTWALQWWLYRPADVREGRGRIA